MTFPIIEFLEQLRTAGADESDIAYCTRMADDYHWEDEEEYFGCLNNAADLGTYTDPHTVVSVLQGYYDVDDCSHLL